METISSLSTPQVSKLRRIAMKKTRDWEKALDLVQEVILAQLEKERANTFKAENIERWLTHKINWAHRHHYHKNAVRFRILSDTLKAGVLPFSSCIDEDWIDYVSLMEQVLLANPDRMEVKVGYAFYNGAASSDLARQFNKSSARIESMICEFRVLVRNYLGVSSEIKPPARLKLGKQTPRTTWETLLGTDDVVLAQQHGLALIHQYSKIYPNSVNIIKEFYSSGITNQELADKYGKTKKAIQSQLNQFRRWVRKQLAGVA